MPEVLFQLSGSIAAYKACHVVSRLVQAGCAVQTVATRAALEFVGPATLEGLTGRAVATDTFAAGSHMDHIHLVRRADLIVLCPATANTINRLAAGIADDLIGTMFLAFDFRVPYIVVPAMNAAMYEHPATAAALDRLTGWGIEVIQPSAGALACGEIGPGRLAEPDDIVANLLGRLGVAPTTSSRPESTRDGRRVLITAGGTTVPIDGVRSITNTSTGRTGAALAAYFASVGYDVTLLHAADAAVPDPAVESITRRSFTTFDDLAGALSDLLSEHRFHAVIHLAAVSDYDVDHVVVDGASIAVDTSEQARHRRRHGDSSEAHPQAPRPAQGARWRQARRRRFQAHQRRVPGRASGSRAEGGGSRRPCRPQRCPGMTGDRHEATIYRSAGDRIESIATVADNVALAIALEREVSAIVSSS